MNLAIFTRDRDSILGELGSVVCERYRHRRLILPLFSLSSYRVAWAMAWNLLNAVLDSCNTHAMSPPEQSYHIPLPVLTKTLQVDEIESRWREDKQKRLELCQKGGENSVQVSCVYQWIASKLGASTKGAIAKALDPVLKTNKGWKADGYPIKKPQRTWLGEGLNSTFTIQLDNLDSPVNKMLLLYVRSYGKLWKSSRLSLVVEGSKPSHEGGAWKQLHKADLDGIHDSQTSIDYSHRINLGDFLQIGSSVRARFTIVGGSRFQINGMALCTEL